MSAPPSISEPGSPLGLRACHLNCDGALQREREVWLRAAWPELCPAGEPALDVLVLTETWLMRGAAPPRMHGYSVYNCQRAWRSVQKSRPHGGIAVYVRDGYVSSDRVQVQSVPKAGVLTLFFPHLTLVACYFSPESSNLYTSGQLHTDPLLLLQSHLHEVSARGVPIVIMGDLNARVGAEVEQVASVCDAPVSLVPSSIPARVTADSKVGDWGRQLMGVLAACGMVLLNGRAPGDEQGAITCRGVFRHESQQPEAANSSRQQPAAAGSSRRQPAAAGSGRRQPAAGPNTSALRQRAARPAAAALQRAARQDAAVASASRAATRAARAAGAVPGDFTCGGSVVDMAMVSCGLYACVTSFVVLPELWNLHHKPILLCLEGIAAVPPAASGGQATQQQQRVRLLRPSSAGSQQFAAAMCQPASLQRLDALCDGLADGSLSVEGAIDALAQHVASCLPRVHRSGANADPEHSSHWWCAELAAARQAVHVSWYRFRACRNVLASSQLLSSYRDKQRHYRRLLRHHKLRFYMRRQVDMINTYFSKQPSEFWRFLRGASTDAMPSDVEAWTRHFSHVFNGTAVSASFFSSAIATQLLPEPTQARVSELACINAPLTVGEVSQALASLKHGKSAGIDGITAECLRVRCVPAAAGSQAAAGAVQQPGQQKEFICAPLLVVLVNRLFVHAAPLPPSMITHTLTPVFKKGNANNLDNYRGIAVGSVVGKVYELVLNARLSRRAEELGLRELSQFGFRPQHGTLDGQFALRHSIDEARAQKRCLYCVFVDFSKAFDLVDRKVLLEVWRRKGVSGPFLAALSSMYEGVRMQFKVQQRLGEAFDTQWGTKQGSVLSPLLFGGLIEQLCALIRQRVPGAGPLLGGLHVPERLYADDVVLAVLEAAQMQQLLDVLSTFCDLFGMTVNLTKTKAVVFAPAHMKRCKALRGCSWHYRDQPISVVTEYTYLGLLFNEKHGCQAAVGVRAKAGRFAMQSLMGRVRALHIDQSDIICRLFDQLVEPVLSFGCQIWGPAVIERALTPKLQRVRSGSEPPRSQHILDNVLDRKLVEAEAVHLDFLRQVGGLPPCSQKWVTLAEFGRKPMIRKWLKCIARWWVRLVRGCGAAAPSAVSAPGAPLSASAFKQNIELYLRARTCDGWAAQVLRCMALLGVITPAQLAACRTVQDVLRLDITPRTVVSRFDALIVEWWHNAGARHADPRTASKNDVCLSTYCQWVQLLLGSPAPHLKQFLLHHHKQTLIRLRTGGYPLRIATGRNEGSGSANVQPGHTHGHRCLDRSHRTCLICNAPGCVEDLKHFLLECPAYAQLRLSYHAVFAGHATTATLLQQPDQCTLAAAVYDMVEYRTSVYLDG